jgi:hypothetical protein
MSYLIKRGDTLSGIAAANHTTVAALAKANNIKNVDLIYAGAKLSIPGHSTKDTYTPPTTKKPSRSSTTAPVTSPGSGGDAGGGSARLAAAGRAAALSMGGTHSQGLCATGVSRAIQSAYGVKVWGNGNQIDDNLPKSKFKEIHIPLSEALKTPGLVLTWEKTSTRLGSIYGHTAITAGDGHSSYSDFIENNTLAGNASRSGLKIFAPI